MRPSVAGAVFWGLLWVPSGLPPFGRADEDPLPVVRIPIELAQIAPNSKPANAAPALPAAPQQAAPAAGGTRAGTRGPAMQPATTDQLNQAVEISLLAAERGLADLSL